LRAHDFQVVTADAIEWEVPDDLSPRPAGRRPAPGASGRVRPAEPLRRAAIRRWSGPTDQRFALYRPDKGLIFDFGASPAAARRTRRQAPLHVASGTGLEAVSKVPSHDRLALPSGS
jgi:hypothetical protein